MWLKRYFPARYYAGRFFPPAGEVAPPVFVRLRTRRGPGVSSRRVETIRSRRGVGVTTRREDA